MIKRKNGKAVRITSSGGKISLVVVRKDGNLGTSEYRNGVLAASEPFYAADDAVKLFDGKMLVRIRDGLFVMG